MDSNQNTVDLGQISEPGTVSVRKMFGELRSRNSWPSKKIASPSLLNFQEGLISKIELFYGSKGLGK